MQESNHLDLTSEPTPSRPSASDNVRPYVGIHFTCCNIYTRIYRDRRDGFYEGRCPTCFKKVRFVEGQGGRTERFFRAQ